MENRINAESEMSNLVEIKEVLMREAQEQKRERRNEENFKLNFQYKIQMILISERTNVREGSKKFSKLKGIGFKTPTECLAICTKVASDH